MKELKTKYDWVPGKKGSLLAPEGSDNVMHTVVVGILPHDVVRILFDGGRLYGQALREARTKYRKKEKSDG